MEELNPRNLLLRSLPPSALEAISRCLERVELPQRFKLAEAGRKSDWVYFPENGIASVIGKAGDRLQEIALFGRDGLGPLSAVFGAPKSPYQVMMQIPGEGFRLSSVVAAKSSYIRSSFLACSIAIHARVYDTELPSLDS